MGVLPVERKWRRRCYLLLGALVLGVVAALAAPPLWVWYHFREAQTALARYHFAEARGHAAICLQAWPNSWRVHLLAARTARLTGASGEAEQHLYQCQQLQPDSPDVLLEWALLHAASGDLASVEEYLWNQVHQGSAQTPLIRGALIEGYVRMYRVSDALACIDDWLKSQAEDTQALFLQGCIWQQVQKPQTALASYRRVVELDPQRDDARWRLAQCLLKVGPPAEAIAHLEYLHQRYPEDLEMAVELARGWFKQGQLAEVRQLLDAVLAEHPDCVSALVERGRLGLAAEDAAEAERWLRRAVAHSPHDPQALHLLSTALLQQGDRDEAQALQDQLKRTDLDFKRLSEICLRELGKRPNDPVLYCELGTLLLRLGYQETGRAWLLSALNQDPNYAPARAALAGLGLGPGDAPNRP